MVFCGHLSEFDVKQLCIAYSGYSGCVHGACILLYSAVSHGHRDCTGFLPDASIGERGNEFVMYAFARLETVSTADLSFPMSCMHRSRGKGKSYLVSPSCVMARWHRLLQCYLLIAAIFLTTLQLRMLHSTFGGIPIVCLATLHADASWTGRMHVFLGCGTSIIAHRAAVQVSTVSTT